MTESCGTQMAVEMQEKARILQSKRGSHVGRQCHICSSARCTPAASTDQAPRLLMGWSGAEHSFRLSPEPYPGVPLLKRVRTEVIY